MLAPMGFVTWKKSSPNAPPSITKTSGCCQSTVLVSSVAVDQGQLLTVPSQGASECPSSAAVPTSSTLVAFGAYLAAQLDSYCVAVRPATPLPTW